MSSGEQTSIEGAYIHPSKWASLEAIYKDAAIQRLMSSQKKNEEMQSWIDKYGNRTYPAPDMVKKGSSFSAQYVSVKEITSPDEVREILKELDPLEAAIELAATKDREFYLCFLGQYPAIVATEEGDGWVLSFLKQVIAGEDCAHKRKLEELIKLAADRSRGGKDMFIRSSMIFNEEEVNVGLSIYPSMELVKFVSALQDGEGDDTGGNPRVVEVAERIIRNRDERHSN